MKEEIKKEIEEEIFKSFIDKLMQMKDMDDDLAIASNVIFQDLFIDSSKC